MLAAVLAGLVLIAGGWGIRNIAIAHASGQEFSDISIWQGYPACSYWNGQVGGIVKAGGADGGEYTDSAFVHNANCLRSQGRYVGSYYFASPPAPDCCGSTSTEYRYGVQQADDYWNRLRSTGIGLRQGETGMLDLEIGNGDQSTYAAAFLDEFYRVSGDRALLYVSLGYLNGHLTGRGIGFANYPLDLADWYYGLPPGAPWPWSASGVPYHGLSVWQWGDTGSFGGIYPVDQDELVASSWPGLNASPSPAPGPAPAPPPPPPPPGCSFGSSAWTASPWWNGDGNQSSTVYKYGGSVSCVNAQFSYGIQVWTGSYWANVCSPRLGSCWDPWTTRSSDPWALSYYVTPCSHLFRAMVAIRSGTGKLTGYKQVGSWVINRDCA